jgi:hypothetical protein
MAAKPRGAKTLSDLMDRHPEKIRGWYKDSDGYWINLKDGWQWQGCHGVHEWNVRDAMASFAQVEPCDCDDCKRGERS